jgi:SAM-dependent methyltransferase
MNYRDIARSLIILLNILFAPLGLTLHRIKTSVRASQLPQRHFDGCKVLSDRFELLSVLPKEGKIAEVGVAAGNFSAEIIRVSQPTILYLVDAWEDVAYQSGLEEVQRRFAQEIADGSVVIKRGKSSDIMGTLPTAYFDWVYIDTSHSYDDTINELRACLSILKPGGRIAGHDFCTGNPYAALPYGVISAVYEFCGEFDWRFEYVTLDCDGYFSFCLKKIDQ